MSTPRDLLLARLAAERARLLHPLIGVSAADLTTKPVHDDWTAANILAHIGDWDRFFCWRFEKVLEGSAAAIPSLSSPDDRNPAVHEAIKGLTLDESVQELESARAAFLGTLSQVDDATLFRFHTMQWGKVKLSTWLFWRGRHDYRHAVTLRRWRRALTLDPSNAPRSVLRSALKAACDDFLVTVRQIADEQGDLKIGEGVTLTDVIRNTADGQIANIIQLRTLEGAAPPEVTASPRDGSYAQAWQDFRRSYVTLEGMLGKLSDTDLTPPRYDIIADALERLIREAALIRASLGVRWPARLLRFDAK